MAPLSSLSMAGRSLCSSRLLSSLLCRGVASVPGLCLRAPGGVWGARGGGEAGTAMGIKDTQTRTAMKKAAGSTRNGRDSLPKYLGMKTGDGERVWPGRIIATQRGYRWHPGWNVGVGKDYTLYALDHGRVSVETGKIISRNPSRNGRRRKVIHVYNDATPKPMRGA